MNVGTGPVKKLSIGLVASPEMRYSFTSRMSCRIGGAGAFASVAMALLLSVLAGVRIDETSGGLERMADRTVAEPADEVSDARDFTPRGRG